MVLGTLLGTYPSHKKETHMKDGKSTDIYTFWKASHCAPGTTDPTDLCGFCGETNAECYKKHTAHIAEHHKEAGGDGEVEACGGSGFHCPKCNRFWAQDACGNSGGYEHQSADGKHLHIEDTYTLDGIRTGIKVSCICGDWLFNEPAEPNN